MQKITIINFEKRKEMIMQQININELKEHPRNTEFFDDMSGDKWKEFLDSVRSRGIIEPIVITHGKVIVSGHQRVRACKELGITSVMCDVHTYNSEDEILQDLLETNVRQRGDVGGSAKKVGLRIKELERIYGIKKGGMHGNQYCEAKPNISALAISQSYIAKQMNMSLDTLQNYKLLAEMIPELEDLLDTGVVTKTTALAIMKNLSSTEQEELISSLDTTKKITQKQMQQYIDKIKQLESRNPEVKVVEKEKIIDKTDYSLEKKYTELQNENKMLKASNKSLEIAKSISENLANDYKSQSDEYMEVKQKLVKIGIDPNGDFNTFQATAQIADLNNEIRELLQNKLAPLKYQDYIFAIRDNDILKKNFMNTLEMINDWYSTMLSYLGEDNKVDYVVDMEER